VSDIDEQTSVAAIDEIDREPGGEGEREAGDGAESDLDKPRAAPLSDPDLVPAAVEAILFVVESPVTPASIAAALQQPEAVIVEAIEALRAGYDARNAGVELRDAAGGVRIYTRSVVAAQVEAFLQDGQRSRLTQAALETLAVIAYRQPVTRARVSAIRGVNVDGVIRTLLSRGLIVEVGSDPQTGGGLFRTTELFLEKMGLQSLEDLPSLAPLLPELDGLDSDEL
jgi:segregation and condensation protein B